MGLAAEGRTLRGLNRNESCGGMAEAMPFQSSRARASALREPGALVRTHFDGCTMIRLGVMAAIRKRIDQAEVGESNA
jgi:hypothetical protein